MSRSSHCHSIYVVIGNGFIKFKRAFPNSVQLKRAHYKFRSSDLLMLASNFSMTLSSNRLPCHNREKNDSNWIFSSIVQTCTLIISHFAIQKHHLFLITWSSFIMITYFTMRNGNKKWSKKFTELYIMSMIHENDMWIVFFYLLIYRTRLTWPKPKTVSTQWTDSFWHFCADVTRRRVVRTRTHIYFMDFQNTLFDIYRYEINLNLVCPPSNEGNLVFFSCFRMISICGIQKNTYKKTNSKYKPVSPVFLFIVFCGTEKCLIVLGNRSHEYNNNAHQRQQQNNPNDLNGLRNWESHHPTKRKTHTTHSCIPPSPFPPFLPLHSSGVSFHFQYVLIFHTFMLN